MGRFSARGFSPFLLGSVLFIGGLLAGCSQTGVTATVVAPTPTEVVPPSPTPVSTATPTPEPTATLSPSPTPSPTRTKAPTTTPTPLIQELTPAYLKGMGWDTQRFGKSLEYLLLSALDGVPTNYIIVDPKTRVGWSSSKEVPWPAGTKTPQTLPGETAFWLWNGQSFQAFNIRGERVLDSQGNYLYFDNGNLAWLKPTPVPTLTTRPEAPAVPDTDPRKTGNLPIDPTKTDYPVSYYPFASNYGIITQITVHSGYPPQVYNSDYTSVKITKINGGVVCYSLDGGKTTKGYFTLNGSSTFIVADLIGGRFTYSDVPISRFQPGDSIKVLVNLYDGPKIMNGQASNIVVKGIIGVRGAGD